MIEKKAEEVARAAESEKEKEQVRHLLVSPAVAKEKAKEAKQKIAMAKEQVREENRKGKSLTSPEIIEIESSPDGDANAIALKVKQEIRMAGVERRKRAIKRYMGKRGGIHRRYKSLAEKEGRRKRKRKSPLPRFKKDEEVIIIPRNAEAIERYRKKRPKIHRRQLQRIHEEKLEREEKQERKKRKERLLVSSSSSSSSRKNSWIYRIKKMESSGS